MNDALKGELEQLVGNSLDEAESVWKDVGDELVCFAANESLIVKAAVESQIPGYPFVEDGKVLVDEFIALVADMRGSTKHLLQAIAGTKVIRLERVYYETAALLPCLARVVDSQDGKVTEFLGDGVLALFRVEEGKRDKAIYAAHRAAKFCLEATDTIINSALEERYSLPPIEIGVGLAISKAVVCLVGLSDFRQPKVFGECVYRATKVSKGKKLIIVEEGLKNVWPTSKGGTLKFIPIPFGSVKGYVVT